MAMLSDYRYIGLTFVEAARRYGSSDSPVKQIVLNILGVHGIRMLDATPSCAFESRSSKRKNITEFLNSGSSGC